MIIGKLDLGVLHPQRRPHTGLSVGSIVISNSREVPHGVGGIVKEHPAEIWCQTPGVIGGAAAGSSAGALFLAKQLEELAGNPDLQPVFVQWTSTTGAITASQDDGFYFLRDLQVDYTVIGTGTVHFLANLAFVSSGPPRNLGMSMAGGALSTGFGGAITNWIAYPLNATVPLVDATRTGAEGAIQLNIGPFLNPSPFVPSSTIADWFKGGVGVYDAMAGIGTNAVPGNTGLFLNANWVEGFGKEHKFSGDIVLTNGLILWSLALTASPGITGYVWNTNLSPAQWQQFGTLSYLDDGANVGTLRQVTLQRVSLEESRADCWISTTAGAWSKVTMRLQRGSYNTRLEFAPMAEANTQAAALRLTVPSAAKIVYNSTNVQDVALSATSLPIDATFGYGAAIINNASYPFLAGMLWQDTTTNQPHLGSTTQLDAGDTGGPAQNASKQYGVFAAPFATPQNLQAEAESGTLGTGWTSQAGAGGNSNALEAKCASGTLTGNADTFGTAWVPPAGAYDVWFRVKVTSAAGAAAEMKLGLYNSTDSVFVSSTTYKANQVTTAYLWYKVAAGVTPTATKNMRFRAETTATIGTDWFVDEAVLAPTTSTTSRSFPQDNFSQFEYDRSTRIRIQ